MVDLIARALADGSTPVNAGPDRPMGLGVGNGVRPAVITDVDPGAEILRRGGLRSGAGDIQAYDGEDDALAMANSTDYGLAGALWASDPATPLAFARRMRTGQVDVNGGAFNPRLDRC